MDLRENNAGMARTGVLGAVPGQEAGRPLKAAELGLLVEQSQAVDKQTGQGPYVGNGSESPPRLPRACLLMVDGVSLHPPDVLP